VSADEQELTGILTYTAEIGNDTFAALIICGRSGVDTSMAAVCGAVPDTSGPLCRKPAENRVGSCRGPGCSGQKPVGVCTFMPKLTDPLSQSRPLAVECRTAKGCRCSHVAATCARPERRPLDGSPRALRFPCQAEAPASFTRSPRILNRSTSYV
jgi:hypothetical protein